MAFVAVESRLLSRTIVSADLDTHCRTQRLLFTTRLGDWESTRFCPQHNVMHYCSADSVNGAIALSRLNCTTRGNRARRSSAHTLCQTPITGMNSHAHWTFSIAESVSQVRDALAHPTLEAAAQVLGPCQYAVLAHHPPPLGVYNTTTSFALCTLAYWPHTHAFATQSIRRVDSCSSPAQDQPPSVGQCAAARQKRGRGVALGQARAQEPGLRRTTWRVWAAPLFLWPIARYCVLLSRCV